MIVPVRYSVIWIDTADTQKGDWWTNFCPRQATRNTTVKTSASDGMFQSDDDYPAHAGEVIDDNFRFRRGVIAAAKRYAKSNPWSGTRAKRIQSLKRFYRAICEIYGIQPPLLNIKGLGKGDSGSSAYVPVFKTIYLRGRMSVVTAIHELGHHLGMDEMAACRWSINLFKRVWPKQFARCYVDRHMLRRFDPNSGRQRTEIEPAPRTKLD